MAHLELRQTLARPINGFWDGGEKSVFNWMVEKDSVQEDSKGKFVKVGSWEANHWFNVALGKNDKQTLANAKRHLTALFKKRGVASTFSYEHIG
jgi:hypothetical protein